jgi:hypothetical protein
MVAETVSNYRYAKKNGRKCKYGNKLEINIDHNLLIYTVIHKSLRDFRPLRYSSRDGHAEG